MRLIVRALASAFTIVAAAFFVGMVFRLANAMPIAAVLSDDVLTLALTAFLAIASCLVLGWFRVRSGKKEKGIEGFIAVVATYLAFSAALFSCVFLLMALVSTRKPAFNYSDVSWMASISGLIIGTAAFTIQKRS